MALVPQDTENANVWHDMKEVVRLWGELDDAAPRFTKAVLWGAVAPTEGLWHVVSAMYMKKQNVLTIEVEPYQESEVRLLNASHQITVVRPACVVQKGDTWTIPEAEGVLLNGVDFPKTEGTAPVQFKP